MLYQNYQKRILRLSTFLAKIVKHMVLICVIAGAAAAVTTGVLAAKGTPQEVVCPTELIYGDDLALDSDAFLSSVKYQFRMEGSEEWTDTVPQLPGTYQVRSVGSSLFGNERYSDPVQFTILPRSVTIRVAEESLVFGDMPTICSDFVKEGDQFCCDKFLYGDVTAPATEITPILSAIRITDENGNDASSGYSIELLPSTVSFRKRPLKVLVGSCTDVYDGTPLSFEQYEIAEGFTLGAEDELMAIFSDFIGPGTTNNDPHLTVYHWQDGVALNVTHQYAIEAVSGTLSVDKRPIYIQSEDLTFTYTGQDTYTSLSLSTPPYSLSTTLPEGTTPLAQEHSLQVTAYPDPTDAGTYENVYKIRITDADGNDVTDCYSLHLNPGTIQIDRAPLSVAFSDRSWVYDGQPHPMVYTVTGLLEGHRYDAPFPASITNTGSLTIDRTDLQLFDSQGRSVTDNYAISFTAGTLTVEKRPISLTTSSQSWTYDGKEHHFENYQIPADQPLAEGQRLHILHSAAVNSVTETPVDNVLAYQIVDGNGQDQTENYSVSETWGTLSVTARPIAVTTETYNGIYDGVAHSGGYTVDDLAENHTSQISGTQPSITDVGSCNNGFAITISDEQGNDVTANYTIRYDYGTLTVTKRPVTITTNSQSWVYDGQPHSDTGYRYNTGIHLVEGHELAMDSYASLTDVGSIDNQFTNCKIMYGNTDVSPNYDLTINPGTLTVTKRPVTIITNDHRWIYDGNSHSDTGYSIPRTSNALVEGHRLQISASTSITEIGSAGNEFTVNAVVDATNADKTGNYDLTFQWGALTIDPIPITVTSGSDKKVYDGTPLTEPRWSYEVTEGALLSGHTVLAETNGTITDPGYQESASINNTFAFYRVVDENNVDVSQYYDFTVVCGTLTIDPIEITITSGSATKVYDGTPLTNQISNYEPTNTGHLPNGHIVWITVDGTITEPQNSAVTTVDNTFSYTITKDGTDVLRYYIVKTKYGKLTVEPIKITATSESATKVYDGTPLTKPTCTYAVTYGSIPNGQIVSVTATGTITEPGRAGNTIVFFVTADGRDVTHCYALTKEEGTLTVTKRSITITSNSNQKIYDGTPLTDPGYKITNGTLAANEDLFVTITGSITLPGSTPNTISTVRITHDQRDVTHCYLITGTDGTLTVTTPADLVFGKIKDDRDGRIYLAMHSYGSYNGQTWSDVPSYNSVLHNGASYAYLTSLALQNSNAPQHTLKFDKLLLSMLPYYMDPCSTFVETEDDRIYYDLPKDYFWVTYYDMISDSYPTLPDEYLDEELAYRNFVYGTYRSIDDETSGFMRSIIAEQGFDPNDPDIINKVAHYIQNAAEYSLEYGNLDNEKNVVIAFLRDYQKGKCTHYASAAVMLYRALGIPARYVEGFMVETTANEYVDIKNPGHAWVEVYIPGTGWVPVEVTGGMGDGGGSGDPTAPTEKKEITVTLYPLSKEYNGSPITYPEYFYTVRSLPEGDQLELNLSFTTPGAYSLEMLNRYSSLCPFRVTRNGVDVTKEYRLVFAAPEGYDPHSYIPMQITPRKLQLTTASASKTYDGTPLTNGKVSYNANALVSGHYLVAVTSGYITQPGIANNGLASIHIYDSLGNDVTQYYDLQVTYGTLTVYPEQN